MFPFLWWWVVCEAAPDKQEAHCFQTLWEVKDDNVAAHQFDTALQNDAELVLGVKDPHEKQKRTFVYDICRKKQLICWWLLWSFYTFGSAEYFTYSDSQSFNGSKQMQITFWLFNQMKPFFSFLSYLLFFKQILLLSYKTCVLQWNTCLHRVFVPFKFGGKTL